MSTKYGLCALGFFSVLGSAALLQAKAPPNRYKLIEDNLIVHDTVTGLWWASHSLESMSQPAAATACTTLKLGTVSGFRLPTRDQLITLIDVTGSAADSKESIARNRNYALDMSVFADAAINGYWTNTPILTESPNEERRYWCIGAERGDAFDDAASGPHPVRCVRQAKPGSP